MPQSVKETLSDPGFQTLPTEEKRKVLVHLDPAFGSLPTAEQDKVFASSGAPPAAATPPGLPARLIAGGLREIETAKGFTKELMRSADNITNLGSGGLQNVIQRHIKVPGTNQNLRQQMEQQVEPSNSDQKAGGMIEGAAEALATIPGVSGMKVPAAASKWAKIGMAAARGAADSVGHAATKTSDPKQLSGAGAVGGAMGGAMGAAGLVPAGKLLANNAREQYAKVLHPAGRAAKEITENKLLTGEPTDLVGRGVWGFTKRGIANKMTVEANAAGEAVKAAYSQLGPQAQVGTRPIINQIRTWLDKEVILPNGKVGDDDLFNETMKLSNNFITKMGPKMGDANVHDVHSFRQMLERRLYASKALKSKEPISVADQVRTKMRDAIGAELNKQHPSIGRVNQAYDFWRSAADVMGDRVRGVIGTEGGKTNFRNFAYKGATAAVIGGTLGASTHDSSSKGIATDVAVGAGLAAAMESPLWRTVSPIMKDRIARVLVSHGPRYASDLAARSVALATVRKTHPSTAYANGQPPPGRLMPGPVRPPLRQAPPEETATESPNAPPQ